MKEHISQSTLSFHVLLTVVVVHYPLTSHCVLVFFSGQSARKNALQVIAEYEGTPAGAVEVPDLSALRELYSEKNPAVPSLRYLSALV